MKAKIGTILILSACMFSSCAVFQKPLNKITAPLNKITAKESDKVVETQKVQSAEPAKTVEPKKPVITKKQKEKASIESAVTPAVTPAENVSSTVSASEVYALNGEWTIQTVNGQKVTGDNRPYINFEASSGNFYSSNGCNILNGSFIVKPNSKIEFANVVSTLKMCADAPFEYLINNAINNASSYKITSKGNENYLTLSSSSSTTPLMILKRNNLDFLNGAWQVAEINGHKNVSANQKLVIDVPELRIHGNAGCNVVNGNIFIDPDSQNSIQFQDLITTRMMCPDADLERQLLVALEEVESCAKNANGQVSLLNSRGKQVLLLTPIDMSEME